MCARDVESIPIQPKLRYPTADLIQPKLRYPTAAAAPGRTGVTPSSGHPSVSTTDSGDSAMLHSPSPAPSSGLNHWQDIFDAEDDMDESLSDSQSEKHSFSERNSRDMDLSSSLGAEVEQLNATRPASACGQQLVCCCLSVCLFVCLSVCLSVYVSLCLSVCLSCSRSHNVYVSVVCLRPVPLSDKHWRRFCLCVAVFVSLSVLDKLVSCLCRGLVFSFACLSGAPPCACVPQSLPASLPPSLPTSLPPSLRELMLPTASTPRPCAARR